MSITPYVNELQNINKEIKRLSIETSKLRKRGKELESHIETFLKDKEQLGVKFGDIAIVMETKSKFTSKPRKDKEQDSIKVLEDYGIENPKEVLERLERAKKGEEFDKAIIKVQKIKPKKE